MAKAANRSLFERLLRLIVWLIEQAYGLDHRQVGELKFMYIVKDDNPDVGYTIVLGDVTDAEGNVIPDAQVTVSVESDNPDAVSVTPDTDRTGLVSFGSPGVANINATVSDANGNILASGSAGFTVTTGDPAAITGVTLTFDGLTEV